MRLAIVVPTQYLATEPSAPPNAIKRYLCKPKPPSKCAVCRAAQNHLRRLTLFKEDMAENATLFSDLAGHKAQLLLEIVHIARDILSPALRQLESCLKGRDH
jgi:hypothetical protein